MSSSPAKGSHPKGRVNPCRALVEQEIYEQAIRLFAEHGFSGTNFQDIPDAVGLTQSAPHHYVRRKDELLAKLAAEFTEDPAASIAACYA